MKSRGTEKVFKMNKNKVAVLADMHLPDRTDTVKEPVFDWALAEAKRRGVELIVGAGDMTAMGTAGAASRLMEKLRATGIPFLNAPGNAELRTSANRTDVLRMMDANQRIDNIVILDNSRQMLSDLSKTFLENLEKNGARNLLAVMHCPIFTMSVDEQVWLDHFIESGVISCLVSGHKHMDTYDDHYPVVRGLDPDKAIGGPPCLVILTWNGTIWEREDIPCPFADPREWPEEEREDFLAHLGISTMADTIGGLKSAVEYRIPCVELRYEPTCKLPVEDVNALLKEWRAIGGKCLSMHAPSIQPDESGEGIVGVETLKAASELAVALGCQAVTMHVPHNYPVGKVVGQFRDRLLDAYSEGLSPLKAAGVTISIENMHMVRGEKIDAFRGYGYTPEECRSWILALRDRMDYANIGFHLDIGHARNNAWYASRFNVSEWYVEMGRMLTGCHLHQVALWTSGKMENHCPIKDLFGQYISLSSFFMAWRNGQLRHVPMYLEIRVEPSLESWISINKELS
jgi:sugar phosphate isomerase/epimerase/predicted phosphodiesterase